MKVKRFILILTCLLLGSAAFAQNIRVTGQVKDAQTGDPVSFVTVIQQGTGNAVSADADGRYAITVPANATLRFSSVGYDELLVEVAGRNVVDVVMNSDNILEEAVKLEFLQHFGEISIEVAAEHQWIVGFQFKQHFAATSHTLTDTVVEIIEHGGMKPFHL